MRIKIIRIAICIMFVVIAASLIYVQAIRGHYFYNLSTNNRIRVVPLEGMRGRILDRNGKVLADNQLAYHATVVPQDIKDKKTLFQFLSQSLEIDEKTLLRRFKSQKITPFAPVVIAENVDRDKAIILEENRFRFPSLTVQEGFQRVYPFEQNGAHVLGYIGKINRSKIERYKEYGYSYQSLIGYSGLEEYYDPVLKGTEGGYQIEVNSRGQQVRLLSTKEPQQGQDIRVTLDHRMQSIAQDVLSDARGSAIVMDATNGEVLAMVSSPTYDPNAFVPGKRKDIQKYVRHPRSPLLNRSTKAAFPPASVFKVIGALAALESKKVNQYTTYDCEGFYEVAGKRFGCTYPHGSQNLTESLIHSCNVYYYRLGLLLGADYVYKFARMFGLGEKTHIDLPYERNGNLPSRRVGLLTRKKKWYTGDTLNFMIGQGSMLATPLQMTHMMATVVNDGKETHPHFIKSIGGAEIDQYDRARTVKIQPKNFQVIKRALRLTVTDYTGTAHDLNIPGLYIGGKTGTAQAGKDKEHHAWFVGYIQSQTYKYAFSVMLEHGGSSHNAVTLAREMLTRFKEEQLL